LEPKSIEDPLPWDHIFYGVTKDYLISEWKKALQGISTPDCREQGCHSCGACSDGAKINLASPQNLKAIADKDLDKLLEEKETQEEKEIQEKKEVLEEKGEQEEKDLNEDKDKEKEQDTDKHGFKNIKSPSFKQNRDKTPKVKPPIPKLLPEYRYKASFKKTGLMVYLGHLEMMEVFKRAFKRGDLFLALSNGFHPSPKLSFMSALPLGVESYDECLLFSLKDNLDPQTILEKLVFPEGISFLSLHRYPKDLPRITIKATEWKVQSFPLSLFNSPPLSINDKEFSYTDNKGHVKAYFLKDYLLNYKVLNPSELLITIKNDPLGAPKPLQIVRSFWDISTDIPLELIKTKTLL
jgi:radical SAM-linked protein